MIDMDYPRLYRWDFKVSGKLVNSQARMEHDDDSVL